MQPPLKPGQLKRLMKRQLQREAMQPAPTIFPTRDEPVIYKPLG